MAKCWMCNGSGAMVEGLPGNSVDVGSTIAGAVLLKEKCSNCRGSGTIVALEVAAKELSDKFVGNVSSPVNGVGVGTDRICLYVKREIQFPSSYSGWPVEVKVVGKIVRGARPGE